MDIVFYNEVIMLCCSTKTLHGIHILGGLQEMFTAAHVFQPLVDIGAATTQDASLVPWEPAATCNLVRI